MTFLAIFKIKMSSFGQFSDIQIENVRRIRRQLIKLSDVTNLFRNSQKSIELPGAEI